MVTMAKGGLSFLLFNFRKILNNRTTVLYVTVVLVFYISWQAGSLVWKLWLINDESPQPTALILLSPQKTEPELLQNLLSYPLIQSASISTSQGAASIDAPKTSLKLKLVGLMYSKDKSQARAIIESQKDGALSYATHERVADNVEIYSIEPDRVILAHAGRQETLMLDPEQKTSSIQPDSGNQPINGPDTNKNQTPIKLQPASRQNSTNAPKNTAELMRDFSATPVMEDDELLGFRLKALRNPEIMEEWGIDPSDVITAVNGIQLNTPGRVMVLYDKLKKQREFEITLNNAGKSRTISVDLYE